jgi:hypothetical protein
MDRGTTPSTRWGLTSGFSLHDLRGPNLHERHHRRSVEASKPAQRREEPETTGSRDYEPDTPARLGPPCRVGF